MTRIVLKISAHTNVQVLENVYSQNTKLYIAVKTQMKLISPKFIFILRSSVVCFGVFSTTVSVNYFTKISLDLHEFFQHF